MVDKITSGYIRLIKRVLNSSEDILYNQVKITSSNRRTINSLRDEFIKINNDMDLDLSGYLYKEDKMYKLDIYSPEVFEGQIIDKNLKQILEKVKGIYLKLKGQLVS